MLKFFPENNTGNIEYKVTLKNINKKKYIKYSTQLKYRILEGYGCAIYLIGVSDNGEIKGLEESFEESIDKINKICDPINCRINFIIKCYYKNRKFLIVRIQSNFNINYLPYII